MVSVKPVPAVSTRTRSWPGPGSGREFSVTNCSLSGPPKALSWMCCQEVEVMNAVSYRWLVSPAAEYCPLRLLLSNAAWSC